jgi:hypothetical protein
MKLTPIKAIRQKCVDCCCGQVLEVRLCPATDCTLHPYRMGKRPNVINDTQDEAGAENMSPIYAVFEREG